MEGTDNLSGEGSADCGQAGIKTRLAGESEEFFFREGCHILEHWNDAADPDASIARARVEPGVSTQVHHLIGTAERYLILEGTGRFISGSDTVDLQAGQVVFIPAAGHQSVTNTGNTDLVFLAICTPRFDPKNYRQE